MEWIFENGSLGSRMVGMIWLAMFYFIALVLLGNKVYERPIVTTRWEWVVTIFAAPLRPPVWAWEKFQAWRFKREFGFWPGSDHGSRQATQRFVDAELRLRAAVFDECCSEEMAFLVEGHKFCKSAKEASDKLADIRWRLSYTKARFWRAHGMARRAYYPVKESYRLYLS